ncbi:MAG: penicillin-binding protein 2 [Oscillatoriales cyanobacterium RM2_1_1]|nr:penicillin-binding protein 2 [Oscillatoriales cyanobacterium SM2_3_0]NJO44877.1 penicillin-binding protein 2 [Oscillatoriales cyanobacterium RM2_1_1]
MGAEKGTDANTSRRQRSFKGTALLLILGSCFGLYGVQLANLQLIQGDYNRQWAETNRLRLIPVPAKRGQLLDRKGRVLAASQLSRSVYLWPREQTPEEWPAIARDLAPILNFPADEILEKLNSTGYTSRLPVRISRDIDPGAFIALAEKAGNWRGIEVRSEPRRQYPNQSLAAHVLGYIGEATLDELKAHPEYPMGMLVGKTGAERLANTELDGVWGNRLIEVDARGEELQELGVQTPVVGESISLTLDLTLQKTAETALGNRRGAVVVINARTGEVLALASAPAYNPNWFTQQLSSAQWQQLQSDENPLLNRAVQGYPPGSTFKPVTAIAGMESGKFSPSSSLATYSSITIGGMTFNEHSGSYGVIGFRDAIAYSSNTFFYQVGTRAGAEEIARWGKELGIGGAINLDLLGLDGANHGQMPTPAEKEKFYGEPWYIGDTVSMSIGQGMVLVTPLELAVMVSTIANGGWRVQPHLLTAQTNTPLTKPIKTSINPEALTLVREGLVDVVRKGTGRRLNDGSIPLTGGKTGTVEIPGKPDNSMYIGFGPADKVEIAVAVVVEEGGYGSVSAAPIAQAVFKTYFAGQTQK